MKTKSDDGAGLAPMDCSPVCPRCGSPCTNAKDSSRRKFFSCESYTYDGEPTKLRWQSDLCESLEATKAAAELLAAIMRDECNAQDEAEKWLRAFAPQYLANDRDQGSAPCTNAANQERQPNEN